MLNWHEIKNYYEEESSSRLVHRIMQFVNMSDVNKKSFALALTEACSSTLGYLPGHKWSENPNTDQETNNLPIQIILLSSVCDTVEDLRLGAKEREFLFIFYTSGDHLFEQLYNIDFFHFYPIPLLFLILLTQKQCPTLLFNEPILRVRFCTC